jgi:hypothetical protein
VFTITYAIAGTGGTIGPFTKGSKQDPPANVTLPIVPRLPDVSGFCLRKQGSQRSTSSCSRARRAQLGTSRCM